MEKQIKSTSTLQKKDRLIKIHFNITEIGQTNQDTHQHPSD
jgi:hypothetical protein